MRVVLLCCFLAASICAHADYRSACKKRDASSEQSWNPSSAGVTPRLRHFYELGHQLEAAEGANDQGKMETLAREYLSAAEEFRCNWNYGNAIHDGNSALGLAALAKRNKASAAK